MNFKFWKDPHVKGLQDKIDSLDARIKRREERIPHFVDHAQQDAQEREVMILERDKLQKELSNYKFQKIKRPLQIIVIITTTIAAIITILKHVSIL